jgi:hypothetical protein
MTETENINEVEDVDLDTEFDESDHQQLPEPEYELTDNSKDEVMRKFGGRENDWDLSHTDESGNMRFDGKEMVDAKGNSLTALIQASGKSEQVAMHLGLLAEWKSNPSKVQLIEYYDGDRLNVTALKLESGGRIDSKTWTREISSEMPILSFDDLDSHGSEENKDEIQENKDLETVEEVIEIDLNQYLASEASSHAETNVGEIEVEKVGQGFEFEKISEKASDLIGSGNIDIGSLEKGRVVFEPRSVSRNLPPANSDDLETIEEIEPREDLLQKAA